MNHDDLPVAARTSKLQADRTIVLELAIKIMTMTQSDDATLVDHDETPTRAGAAVSPSGLAQLERHQSKWGCIIFISDFAYHDYA